MGEAGDARKSEGRPAACCCWETRVTANTQSHGRDLQGTVFVSVYLLFSLKENLKNSACWEKKKKKGAWAVF